MTDVAVAVIGSGIAGRMAAMAAAESADTLLLTDGPLDRCNSIMAQGGIHAPVDDAEDAAAMAADVAASARVPVDPDRVRQFVTGALEATTRLQDWGLAFDREPDGSLRRRLAGGMSRARVLTVGDDVGVPLLRVLGDRLAATAVTVRTHTAVLDVRPGTDAVSLTTGSGDVISARTVVVATGGGAFARALQRGEPTTNPRNGNHRLYTTLVALGARTRDEEYWQWQPFGLVDGPAGPPGRCVPETVAALGPRLLDRHGTPLVELPVDRLTLTEAMTAAAGRAVTGKRGKGFLLTLSDLSTELLRTAYPKLHRTLEQMNCVGGDVVVRPFLHYQLGGIAIDGNGATSLPRVYAAGEVTGGLHGRNRLMGAGISDALVHGWSAGTAAARVAVNG